MQLIYQQAPIAYLVSVVVGRFTTVIRQIVDNKRAIHRVLDSFLGEAEKGVLLSFR